MSPAVRRLALWLLPALPLPAADANWDTYLGDKAGTQYSTLREITPANVSGLQVAWSYRAGGLDGKNRTQIQCNPLVIDGVLYGTTPDLQVFAVDAATGREKWRFNPTSIKGLTKVGVNRGIATWTDGRQRRLFYASHHWLHAIDAATGQRVPGFGREGTVDFYEGLGRDASNLSLQVTSPGIVFRDLLILGMRVGEGPAPAAPGPIRAYDVRTGALVWRFNTIPQPGESGHETWPPEAWKYTGGGNVWTGFALDEKRGLVFCPTGSAAFDFWGGNRIGQNLYTNCLLALDAATGRRVWHFQFVHHDLWDRDLPSPPDLLTVTHGGRRIDAVAQTTKSGHVFVFNRETGEPLFPIDEVPVPKSDIPGEAAWSTQPRPRLPAPFARQVFTYDEITTRTPEAHRAVLEKFATLRPHVPFMPPSREGTIILPGFDGGAEWGGAATDPEGILYVNANEMPWILQLVDAKAAAGVGSASGQALFTQICAACHGLDRKGNAAANVPSLVDVAQRLKLPDVLALLQTGKGMMPSFAFLSEAQRTAVANLLFGVETPPDPRNESAANEAARRQELEDPADALGRIPFAITGYNRWLDPDGYPAIKPPWGTLNAINLNTGEFLWRTPLGEWPDLAAKGLRHTGTENYGGPIVTAGGLVFIAASRDEHLRAFDRRTGKELWKAKLPAAGYATPATYAVGGRQYVVIACGGGKIGTPSGDTYVAFALPR
ncbi:MAG: PQQ-binding-like beta-propeller repeat protein [Verrucomicrobia bacterium]|nr:PQQ-binding-like beta-propeller repeat protein [Verrucomicrobiota bacterium]